MRSATRELPLRAAKLERARSWRIGSPSSLAQHVATVRSQPVGAHSASSASLAVALDSEGLPPDDSTPSRCRKIMDLHLEALYSVALEAEISASNATE